MSLGCLHDSTRTGVDDFHVSQVEVHRTCWSLPFLHLLVFLFSVKDQPRLDQVLLIERL